MHLYLSLISCRLEDVVHSDRKLYLVFEYLDLDLKKHMDSHPNFGTNHQLVKVDNDEPAKDCHRCYL